MVLSLLSCSTNSSNSLQFFYILFLLEFYRSTFFLHIFFTHSLQATLLNRAKKNRPSHFAFYLFSVFYYWFFDYLDGKKQKKSGSRSAGLRSAFFLRKKNLLFFPFFWEGWVKGTEGQKMWYTVCVFLLHFFLFIIFLSGRVCCTIPNVLLRTSFSFRWW